MTNLGGGAEARARSQQYDYHANSSLVLTTDLQPREKHVATGELESMHGKIDPKSFGDRAACVMPLELEWKIKNLKKKKELDLALSEPEYKKVFKRRKIHEESVLSLGDECVYKPKTKEALAAYVHLLSVIEQQIGFQPQDVLASVADEILSILKNEMIKNSGKQKKIEKLLSPITNKLFDQLVSIGQMITDFQYDEVGVSTSAVNGDNGAFDDDIGVAIEFEDEEEETDFDQIQEYEDEEDIKELDGSGGMQMSGVDVDEIGEAKEGFTLNVQDIDAYWLQRKISNTLKIDPQHSHKLAEHVLEILGEGDDINVGNRLVVLLEYENYDFIKLLLRNRLKIVWCTRLTRAEDQGQRKKIEEEMSNVGPPLSSIVGQLHATRSSAKEHQRNLVNSIREEARRLKDEHGSSVFCERDSKSVAVDGGSDSNVWLQGQRQLLDLESVAFQQGVLSMANIKYKLPRDSIAHHKGYEEVHVPALMPKPLAQGEELVKIAQLPEWAQPVFAGLSQLNQMQSKVYKTAFFTPENILLCAPTGAGKTNVAMLTILHEIALHRNEGGEVDNTKYKIVYIAPMKALVAEIVGNLSGRLKHFNINVKELSGDQSLTCHEIEETQIIVATPEKWDIVTRKSGDRTYTQMVRLVMIDEIHLLHDNRGPVLESIVARTVRQIETTKEHIRLVGLSATLPNYEDIAIFLRVNHTKGLFHFDNSYRPCPLVQQYVGITVKKPHQRFQLMNNICYKKVLAAAGKHQVLIFVHSRKETSKTARAIRDTALANNTLSQFLRDDSASREILLSQTDLVRSDNLKNLLLYGFAIHHAGMNRSDRSLVEYLFKEGHIQVLVSTATLAWGVNLPAHTVIIKGTQVYNPEKGAWTELSVLDVMQMLGRAGRPQYDSCGEGIILTEHSKLQYYLSLINQQLPIESQLISKLADQLNAEIVLGTIQNVQEACTWIGYTYLYIRMLRNPSLYGIPAGVLDEDKALEERRADMIHTAACTLDKNNLIKYDRKSGYFQATDLGRIASYYYITQGTISTYNKYLKPTTGVIELFRIFSLSEEFKYVSVRQEEKMELTKLLEEVPVPVRESMEEPSAKINVLLQAFISQLKLEGLSLTCDMVYIRQSAGRLLRAVFEIVLRRGWAQLSVTALNLCKMVDKRIWNVQIPLRQFHSIPDEILSQLEKKDLDWERYYDLSSQEIGELIRCHKMGKTLHKYIRQLPKVNLSAHVQPITRTTLGFELTVTPDFQWNDKVHGYVEPFWVIVEDNDQEHVLHHEYFLLKKQYIEEDSTVNFIVHIFEPLPPQYFVRVVSDRWLGSEAILPVSVRHLILPEKHLPPTKLLDLQPLPVAALRSPKYEMLYAKFEYFSPIQTQAFTVLYNTDDNVLLAAPEGSGKTICAEFALLRSHQKMKEGPMRAIYIAPVEGLAKARYHEWEEKFGTNLGLNIVELTGETASDLKSLEGGNIIISTPEKWDALSRRWKQRKHVQQVSLFIVDKLHFISEKTGPVLEIIVSRMKRIASHVGSNIRIIALSASLANAKDLGEWIGATSRGLFNFPPSAHPAPLEIHIQSVDIANCEARMRAMIKPTYTAIVQHANNGKPALVYVPTWKHARLTALDLCTYSMAENCNRPLFLLKSEDEISSFIAEIRDDALKFTISHGVGYIHEGLGEKEQDIILHLYLEGFIQVCVASSSMCWGKPMPSHVVVVMGTQYFNWHENAHADYSITHLLQMIGQASRPLLDDSGKCVILCHAPKKEYYKKFLYESFPVESPLPHFLHDHLNAEVVAGVVESKQDAVDYLTWTFMFRRLTKNPNYYNLHGVGRMHLSDHLSDLVENALSDLESSQCVIVEEDTNLKPSNLGLIASYHYISYTTVERFYGSLTQKTRLRGLIEILTSASEYADLPIRPGEDELIGRLIKHQRYANENPRCTNPHVKANALLQAHFSRHKVVGSLEADQKGVLLSAHKLIHAMVDVISSNGWLSLAVNAMELSQMVTQGMWGDKDSVLLQLPHFTKELAIRCAQNSINTIFELQEMEDDKRRALLQMSDAELSDVARYCNRFPNIDVDVSVLDEDGVTAGDNVTVQVVLERDYDGQIGKVHASWFPRQKEEGWWLVVGDPSTDQLLAIKRVMLQRRLKVKLGFAAPNEVCTKAYKIYFICDSYLGCDQEYEFTIHVNEGGKGSGGNQE